MVLVEVTDEYHPQTTQFPQVPGPVAPEVPLELEQRAHAAVHHDTGVSDFTHVDTRHIAIQVAGLGGTA